MITTIDETGVWNNYAAEPDMYFAEYPSEEQQSKYMLQAGAAVLFLSSLFMLALIAS